MLLIAALLATAPPAVVPPQPPVERVSERGVIQPLIVPPKPRPSEGGTRVTERGGGPPSAARGQPTAVLPAAAADPIGRELEPPPPARELEPPPATPAGYVYPPPLGYTGPSGILPRSGSNPEYDTVEDRWRVGFPDWDRYGLGRPRVFDYPYKLGRKLDPYNQNVLKGDYPILGQDVFVNLTGTSATLTEGRSVPTATTPFESTARPVTTDFFGRPGQFVTSSLLTLSADLFRGTRRSSRWTGG